MGTIRLLHRVSAFGLFGFASLVCTAQTPSSPFQEGRWQGTLSVAGSYYGREFLAGEYPPREDPLELRLRIYKSGRVTVRAFLDGRWAEPIERYRMIVVGANAVIAGAHSDGQWVESWVLNVTMRNDDTMLVHWSAVVNNTRTQPGAEDYSKFGVASIGELHRGWE